MPQSVDPQLLSRELQGLLRKPAVELADNRDSLNETLYSPSPFDEPSDSTASRRSENSSIVAPPPVDSSTDPTLDKFSGSQQLLKMPETHLL